jgi:hypothetical protein
MLPEVKAFYIFKSLTVSGNSVMTSKENFRLLYFKKYIMRSLSDRENFCFFANDSMDPNP